MWGWIAVMAEQSLVVRGGKVGKEMAGAEKLELGATESKGGKLVAAETVAGET